MRTSAPVATSWGRAWLGVVHGARSQVRELLAAPGAFLVISLVQPAAIGAILLALAPDIDAARATRWSVGVANLSLWSMAVWSVGGTLRLEKIQGTLSRLVTGVVQPAWVILGRSLGAIGAAAAGILGSLAFVMIAAGRGVVVEAPLLFAGAAVLSVFSAAAFGLLLAALFVRTRMANRISEAILYPVYIFGGILLPLDLFPPAARIPANAVSLYWGRRAATEAALNGAADPVAFLMLAGLSAAYLALGLLALRSVVNQIRSTGRIDVF